MAYEPNGFNGSGPIHFTNVRILVAGDDQGRAVDEPVIGALGLRQRLAGAGKSFRILAHMALAHKRDRNGIVACGRSGKGRLRQLVCDRAHSLVTGGRGALAQPFACRILGLEDRPEQGETRHALGMARGDVLRDERAEGMTNDVGAVDAKMRCRIGDRLHQERDRDLLRRGRRPSRSGKVGPHEPKSRERGQERLKAV